MSSRQNGAPQSACPSNLRLEEPQKRKTHTDSSLTFKDLSIIIKNIYDHHKNIKIYVTGSSSLAIKYKIQESLASRKTIAHLYPLDFEEFLNFKGRKELLEQAKNVPSLSGENLFAATKELYSGLEEFIIFGGYPEAVLSDKKQAKITDTIKFWQDKNQTEIDFVIEANKALTAIEVKLKQSLTSGNLSAFNKFRRDYSGAGCFLVSLSSQKTFKKIKTAFPYKVAHSILSSRA